MSPATSRPSVSFIVPALNEGRHIEKTVATILEAVAASGVSDYQIVLVDDGSTDATGRIMDQVAASRGDKIQVVHNLRNTGFGGAYKRGVTVARCDYVMIVAGDNLMPATSITTVLDQLGKADIILPYMADMKQRPLGRRIGSWGFATVINTLFGFHIHYYNSMVPRRALLNKITINTEGYALQAETIVKLLKAGYSYAEISVPHGMTVRGGSSALRVKNLVNLFKDLCALIKEVRRPGAIPAHVPVESTAGADKS